MFLTTTLTGIHCYKTTILADFTPKVNNFVPRPPQKENLSKSAEKYLSHTVQTKKNKWSSFKIHILPWQMKWQTARQSNNVTNSNSLNTTLTRNPKCMYICKTASILTEFTWTYMLETSHEQDTSSVYFLASRTHCIVDSFLYCVWWPVWRTIFSQPTHWNHSKRMFPNKFDDSMCNAIHRSYNDTNQVNMTYEKFVVTTYTTSMDTKSFAALNSMQSTTAPRIGQNCALLLLYKGKPSMLNCTTTESKPFPADSLQSSSWHHNLFSP